MRHEARTGRNHCDGLNIDLPLSGQVVGMRAAPLAERELCHTLPVASPIKAVHRLVAGFLHLEKFSYLWLPTKLSSLLAMEASAYALRGGLKTGSTLRCSSGIL